jgi:hypothetical protein
VTVEEKLETLRFLVRDLRARVAQLEQQGGGQRQRGGSSSSRVVVLAGTGPRKRPRGAQASQQTRVMRSGIR